MNKEEIEELAFKDRKELANLNELDLLEIIEFLQLDRKQWINQYSTAHNDYVDLQQKIKELEQERDLYKEVIEEVRKYIEDWLFDAGGNGASMTYEDINELLQILDKIIGDDK